MRATAAGQKPTATKDGFCRLIGVCGVGSNLIAKGAGRDAGGTLLGAGHAFGEIACAGADGEFAAAFGVD